MVARGGGTAVRGAGEPTSRDVSAVDFGDGPLNLSGREAAAISNQEAAALSAREAAERLSPRPRAATSLSFGPRGAMVGEGGPWGATAAPGKPSEVSDKMFPQSLFYSYPL